MLELTVTDRDGAEHPIASQCGYKLMEALRDSDNDFGILAMCGGACSCATCHVYVDPVWMPRLPARQSDERALLGELAHYQDTSRLSCQIELTEALHGLRVTIAPDE
jgi:2Fe-2S ferredoxin